MKLNPDCMRDILLFLEKQDVNDRVSYKELVSSLPGYSDQELFYTALKLEEAGFINASTANVRVYPELLTITDITFNGHQFLDDIRDNSNWQKIKAIGEKAGSLSVKAIAQIAVNLISSFINNQFQ